MKSGTARAGLEESLQSKAEPSLQRMGGGPRDPAPGADHAAPTSTSEEAGGAPLQERPKPVSVDALRVSLPGAGEVLHGVSLELRRGEVLGLLGPNGAGKSTLVRAIAGLVPASAGSVRIDGAELRSLTRAALARKIAYLNQEMPFGLPFTAAEVVLMGRSPHLGFLGLDGLADRQKAWAALERVEAGALADRKLDALSGGERRRVLLAKLIAQEAPIWILDEPTAHLDLAHQHLAMRVAREHADSGGAALCVLHDINQAVELCERVVVMREGGIVSQGPPASVLDAALLGEVFRVPFVTMVDPQTGATRLLPNPHLRGSGSGTGGGQP